MESCPIDCLCSAQNSFYLLRDLVDQLEQVLKRASRPTATLFPVTYGRKREAILVRKLRLCKSHASANSLHVEWVLHIDRVALAARLAASMPDGILQPLNDQVL